MNREILSEVQPSTVAWLALGAGVTAYDLTCPEGQTLSESVHRLRERRPTAAGIAVGVTALHLLNVLPKPIDPFHQVLKRVKA